MQTVFILSRRFPDCLQSDLTSVSVAVHKPAKQKLHKAFSSSRVSSQSEHSWLLLTSCICVSDLRQELAVQQKQQVQERKPSLSSAVKEPSSSSSPSSSTSSSMAGLPTPPLTPPDKRVEDKTTSSSSNQPAPSVSTPSRPPAAAESFSTPLPSISRGRPTSVVLSELLLLLLLQTTDYLILRLNTLLRTKTAICDQLMVYCKSSKHSVMSAVPLCLYIFDLIISTLISCCVPAGESLSGTPLTTSARISALNIVGELLRKVGVRASLVIWTQRTEEKFGV